MENCPGWGNIWTQLEFLPECEILYENPLFIDLNNYNFILHEDSPCINSGNPNIIDEDNSISDIGANTFIYNNCLIIGDINNDLTIDILDVIQLVCFILESSIDCLESNECNDINNDNVINIIDIITLVNIIIN